LFYILPATPFEERCLLNVQGVKKSFFNNNLKKAGN